MSTPLRTCRRVRRSETTFKRELRHGRSTCSGSGSADLDRCGAQRHGPAPSRRPEKSAISGPQSREGRVIRSRIHFGRHAAGASRVFIVNAPQRPLFLVEMKASAVELKDRRARANRWAGRRCARNWARAIRIRWECDSPRAWIARCE